MIKTRSQPRTTNSSKFKLKYLGRQILDSLYDWRRLDWFLLLSVVALTIFGGFTIYSTESSLRHNYSYQHWTISLLGLGLVLFLSPLALSVSIALALADLCSD